MQKGNWIWNILVVLAVVVSIAAFALHYQNYVSIKADELKIFSGVYRKNVPLGAVDSLYLVEKFPKMERQSGFSWLAKEKGVFKDSLYGTNTYVFVDDLNQTKIKMVYQDSLVLYWNTADSLETRRWYGLIKEKLAGMNNTLE